MELALLGGVVAEARDVSSGSLLASITPWGASMSSEAMRKATNAANEMVRSAGSGGFKVTKEAADPIIKVLENFIDEVQAMKGSLRVFDRAPNLGSHDYGRKVAEYMREAANDDRSVRASLESLQVVLERSREALLKASDQYQEQEESTRKAFRNMGG